MEALYHETNKRVQEVQLSLGRLERASSQELPAVETEVQTRIDQIISSCERLETLVNKEPPMRRPNAKLRVDQLKYDCQHLQSALRNMQHRRYQRQQEELEREALMSTEFRANDDTSIAMDQAMTHNSRLNDAHKGMDELLLSGSGILGNLREQHVSLKGVQRKMLDVANTLGLSNTVLRLVERRTHQDKFILYGGIIVSCIIMFLVWRYLT